MQDNGKQTRGRRLGLVALALALCWGVGGVSGDPLDPRPKKLIETGWDQPDAARLRQNLAQMEQQPFDGVVIDIVGQADGGRRVPVQTTFGAGAWQRSWFQGSIDDLNACHFHRFTDNFVLVGANPGNVDWFDDAGWKDIVDHWRIAAWIAHEAHLKGLVFDPEPYTEPFRTFDYGAQPGRAGHSYEQYAAEARKRGREVMEAISQIDPNLTLFAYFMNSANQAAVGHDNAQSVLEDMAYGLYPWFIDGWLDAAPPTLTFVDGSEGNSYRANSDNDYLHIVDAVRNRLQDLVVPEDRREYSGQVQAGVAVYLDAYINPPTSPYYIDPQGGSRVGRLATNVATAARVSDQYVWVYGEQCEWWPTPDKRVKSQSWEAALPGISAALDFACHPELAIGALQTAGTLRDLTVNGDFGQGPDVGARPAVPTADWQFGVAPAQWSTWQADDSHGSFGWDAAAGHGAPGAARAAAVDNGCFSQSQDVAPGECYVISAYNKLAGHGTAWIRVRWQDSAGKWISENEDVLITPSAAPQGKTGGWQELFGKVQVPDGAHKLLILLCVAGQNSPADVAWFDDVRLLPLS